MSKFNDQGRANLCRDRLDCHLSGLHGQVANRAASFLSADITFGISNMFPSGGGGQYYSGQYGMGSSYNNGRPSGNSADLGAEHARLLSHPTFSFSKSNVLADSFATHADTAMAYVGGAVIVVGGVAALPTYVTESGVAGMAKNGLIGYSHNEPLNVIKIDLATGFAEGVITAYAKAALDTNINGKILVKLGEVTKYQLINNWPQ